MSDIYSKTKNLSNFIFTYFNPRTEFVNQHSTSALNNDIRYVDEQDTAVLACGEGTWKLRSIYKKYETRENHLPEENLRKALQEFSLKPSQAQVFEMLRYAGSSREATHSVTLGEFCVLATELAHHYSNRSKQPVPECIKNKPCLLEQSRKKGNEVCSRYQVFLGGSCNPTTWRTQKAIPHFKKRGITFYNPQVTQWRPELVELEAEAKENADLLLFVIDSRTRATVSKVEVAYLLGQGRTKIIPVVNGNHNIEVAGEIMSECEKNDLLHSHTLIQDLMERLSIPVHNDVDMALEYVEKFLAQESSSRNMTNVITDGHVQDGHLRVGQELGRLRLAFLSQDIDRSGVLNLHDLCLAYNAVMRPDILDQTWVSRVKPSKTHFSFDDFCSIIVERKHIFSGKSRLQDILTFVVNSVKWVFGVRTSETKQKVNVHDIYMAGCENTDWMTKMAVPEFRKHGLTYRSRSPSDPKHPHLTPSDALKQDSCKVLLHVITSDSCGAAGMVEAAYNIGRGCRMILCVQPIKGNSFTRSDKLSPRAIEDYNRGRVYLSDLANRGHVPCFEDLNEAINATVDLSRNMRLSTTCDS